MPDGFAKKIVVIRDIASNYIEEAIIILKNYPGECTCNSQQSGTAKKRKTVDDFILKEAEAVIINYMKENKIQQIYGERTAKRFRSAKTFRENLVINLALAGSIALLLFLLTRIF